LCFFIYYLLFIFYFSTFFLLFFYFLTQMSCFLNQTTGELHAPINPSLKKIKLFSQHERCSFAKNNRPTTGGKGFSSFVVSQNDDLQNPLLDEKVFLENNRPTTGGKGFSPSVVFQSNDVEEKVVFNIQEVQKSQPKPNIKAQRRPRSKNSKTLPKTPKENTAKKQKVEPVVSPQKMIALIKVAKNLMESRYVRPLGEPLVPVNFDQLYFAEDGVNELENYILKIADFNNGVSNESINNMINQGLAIQKKVEYAKKADRKISKKQIYADLADFIKLKGSEEANVLWFQRRQAIAKIKEMLNNSEYNYSLSATELMMMAPNILKAYKLGLLD